MESRDQKLITLIYCNSCADVVRLYKTTRTCACGKSGGHYKDDGYHAQIWGHCKPLNFAGSELSSALEGQLKWGKSIQFFASVMPQVSPQIEHVDIELQDLDSIDPFTRHAHRMKSINMDLGDRSELGNSSSSPGDTKRVKPKNVFRDGPS